MCSSDLFSFAGTSRANASDCPEPGATARTHHLDAAPRGRVAWKIPWLFDVMVATVAFGMGIERAAMLKYGVPDLRNFFESDMRWLRHYGFLPIEIPSLTGGLTR